jgi:hypothetical protein
VTSGITSFPVSAMATANPRQFYCSRFSWWQLDLCKSYLGLYARSRQSQHFSKYGCTPQMIGLAPFGPLSGISLARHKITILFVPPFRYFPASFMAVACGLIGVPQNHHRPHPSLPPIRIDVRALLSLNRTSHHKGSLPRQA